MLNYSQISEKYYKLFIELPPLASADPIELLWHNWSVVMQPQAHHRPAPPSDRDRSGASGLTGEETAAWFPDTLDTFSRRPTLRNTRALACRRRRLGAAAASRYARPSAAATRCPGRRQGPAGMTRPCSRRCARICVRSRSNDVKIGCPRPSKQRRENRLPTTSKTAGCYLAKEKVHVTSLNFRESPFFFLKLQNRTKHLPQLSKPFILPPWPVISSFEDGFIFFLFYLFWVNL